MKTYNLGKDLIFKTDFLQSHLENYKNRHTTMLREIKKAK